MALPVSPDANLTGAARGKVIFIASNTNQVRMWTGIANHLLKNSPRISIEICSLELYYGQIDCYELATSNLCYILFPRKYSKGIYWDSNLYEKIFMYLEVRLQAFNFYIRNSPDLLVFGNDIGLIEQVLITEANNRNIPTLLVQDGILQEHAADKIKAKKRLQIFFRKFFRFFPHSLYGLGGTKKIAVMGQYTRKLLEGMGVHSSCIVETGHPRFDKLASIRLELNDKRRLDAKQNAGFDTSLPIVGFISQPMIRYRYVETQKWERIIRDIGVVAKELEGQFNFFIKLHPSEIKDEFNDRYEDMIKGSRIKLFHKEDIYNLFYFVDMIVVYNSTVSLEAMMVDIPVVIYNPYSFSDDFHFVELGGAVIASNKKDLISILKKKQNKETKILSSLGREKAVGYHAGVVDGYASQRIANLIRDMVISNI